MWCVLKMTLVAYTAVVCVAVETFSLVPIFVYMYVHVRWFKTRSTLAHSSHSVVR